MATETVSIVFTDLVGSTKILSRLGENRAETLRREFFDLLRSGAGAHGGREVKNLGDGLMFVFPSASDSVAGAVTIQQLAEVFNRTAEVPLVIRAGGSTGDADVADDDYFGLAVVEAARLCASAQGGQILVTASMRDLARGRTGLVFSSLGELELKGFDAAVPAYEVVWDHLEVEGLAPPLPSRLSAISPVGFVGRHVERERLDMALKSATAGERRVVLLSGEPGIGKTALASSFAHAAFDNDAVVLYGRCDEDLGTPYQPWVEALSHLVRFAPDSLLDAHISARRCALARLVPELLARAATEALPPSDFESERYLLFGAVVDLLARASEQAPLVVVLDDLHCADQPTLQLLRHVVTADASLRLVILATCRDSEVGTGHPLAEMLAALHRESQVERLAMRGLDDSELLALLETNAGHELAEDGIALRDALALETAGNPFFVGEILRHLAETGLIYVDDYGRWAASADISSAGLPVSIREVVGWRVARLGDPAVQVLSMAAVIGRDFGVEVLGRIVDIDEEALIDVLEAAVSSAVVTEGDLPGEFRFAHALIEHTLYRDMSAIRRARAHRAVAETFEELIGDQPDGRVRELAYHWARANQPQETGKAIRYAQMAGDRALVELAPEEAIEWYRSALELLDHAPASNDAHRPMLLAGLGDAQRQIGDPAHRDMLLAAARLADRCDDVNTLVRAALANNRGFFSVIGAVDTERVEMLRVALARLGDSDPPRKARLLATLCVELTFDTKSDKIRLSLAEEAVSVARQHGDPGVLADALVRTFYGIATPDTRGLRLAWTAEACTLVSEEQPALCFLAHAYHAIVSLEASDIAGSRAALAAARAIAQRTMQPQHLWQIAFYSAVDEIVAGDIVAVEAHASEALQIGLELQPTDAMVVYGAALLTIRVLQGRVAELTALVDQLRTDYPELATFRAVECLVAAEMADLTRANELIDRDLAEGFDASYDALWLTTQYIWAMAAVTARHIPAAEVLLERLTPWTDHVPTMGATCVGSVAQQVGELAHLLGHDVDADTHFARALEMNERLQAPAFVAWTQAAWGSFLVDRHQPGDADRAAEMLELALATAVAGGYGMIEHQARATTDRLH